MLLAIDLGNTNTVFGVYDGEQLIMHWRLSTQKDRTVDEFGILLRNLFSLERIDAKRIRKVIIASREYRGGLISPGIVISAEALYEHAAKLPRIEIQKPAKLIGTTAITSMQS